MATLATTEQRIARPLKILIPLIKDELAEGDSAGHVHYRLAGALLNEAKEQVPYGQWTRWLTTHFALSKTTANTYMRWAREHSDGAAVQPSSLREMTGHTQRAQGHRAAARSYQRVLRDLEPEAFRQERQTQKDEVQLHRDLALELIDIGWKALATRLHPDHGGSREAMRRLNVVRAELKGLAQTRRFV